MKKADYIRECLKRNEKLQADILAFHRQFPLVFFRESWKGKPLPNQLKPLLKTAHNDNDFYIGTPKTIGDLLLLNTHIVLREGFREIFPEDKGETYWKIIEKTPAEWVTAFYNLRQTWPKVDKVSLLYGIFQPCRRFMVVPDLPFDLERWKDDLINLTGAVKMVIPVYEDTSADDIDWKQVAYLQDILYGTKQRATPSKYKMKLKVWDTYQKEKDFVEVSRRLKKPRTTVKSIYDSVAEDILGFIPRGTIKAKRAIGFDAQFHMNQCSQCREARSTDQMCAQTRVFVDQAVKSQRELTGGRAVEIYKKTTSKRQTSDEYFEREGKVIFQRNLNKMYKG